MPPRNVCIVGARDLDSKERRIIKDSGVHVFTMRDIDERGMREVMTEAIRVITSYSIHYTKLYDAGRVGGYTSLDPVRVTISRVDPRGWRAMTAPTPPADRPLCVLGMHRSGTSLVTRP